MPPSSPIVCLAALLATLSSASAWQTAHGARLVRPGCSSRRPLAAGASSRVVPRAPEIALVAKAPPPQPGISAVCSSAATALCARVVARPVVAAGAVLIIAVLAVLRKKASDDAATTKKVAAKSANWFTPDVTVKSKNKKKQKKKKGKQAQEPAEPDAGALLDFGGALLGVLGDVAAETVSAAASALSDDEKSATNEAALEDEAVPEMEEMKAEPAAAPAAAPAAKVKEEDDVPFIPAAKFEGAKKGYAFKTGPEGKGYYNRGYDWV